jgi:methylmalonyl-CoA mutase N-terminal domain/subunit
MNNIVRVTIECLAGVLGGCQSLFPSSMDEAYCTPSENSVKLALRTQQIIAYETGIADTIDPLGGSYYVEALTCVLENEAKKHLDEIKEIGGTIKAIESGYFQEKIGEFSYRQYQEIQNKERIVVGVNKFVDEEDVRMEIFRPPEDTALKQKIKLKKLREMRNNRKVKEILKEIEALAQTEENLVPILVEAVKHYVTVGEICDVFRHVFGEYRETKF